MLSFKNAGSGVVWVALLLGLGACSQDKHTFISTSSLPTTVQIKDAYSENIIWMKEIPVGHKLVLDFDRPLEIEPLWANMQPATKMQWKLFEVRTDLKRWTVLEKHKVELPGTQIIMKVTYRKAPEFPPGYKAPGTPPGAPPETATPPTVLVPATDGKAPKTAGPTTAPAPGATTSPANESEMELDLLAEPATKPAPATAPATSPATKPATQPAMMAPMQMTPVSAPKKEPAKAPAATPVAPPTADPALDLP